jgi:hypothetical protein
VNSKLSFSLIFLGFYFLINYYYTHQLNYAIKPFWLLSPNKNNFLQKTKAEKSFRKDPLWDAIVLGQASFIPKEHLELWKKLGIMHFLSPGAMHVSAIFIWFKFQKIKKFLVFIIFITLISFLIHHQKNYFPMERTLFFVWLKNIKFPLKFSFFATVLFDVLIFNTMTAPLSFLFSFWFWYIIIFSANKIHRFLFLYLAQCALMGVNGQNAYALLILISPILNLFLTLSYPLLLLLYWIPTNHLIDFSLLQFCDDLFKGIDAMIRCSPAFNEVWIIWIGIIQLLGQMTPSKALLITLIFNATNLGNKQEEMMAEIKVFNKTYYRAKLKK